MFLWLKIPFPVHERQLLRLIRTFPYVQETLHRWWWYALENRRYSPASALITPNKTKEFNMSSVICRARYSHFLLRLFKKSKINPQVRQRGAPDTNTLSISKIFFKARFLHSSLIIYKLNCNKQRLLNEVKFYLMSITPYSCLHLTVPADTPTWARPFCAVISFLNCQDRYHILKL